MAMVSNVLSACAGLSVSVFTFVVSAGVFLSLLLLLHAANNNKTGKANKTIDLPDCLKKDVIIFVKFGVKKRSITP
jgi:hypothetical protein